MACTVALSLSSMIAASGSIATGCENLSKTEHQRWKCLPGSLQIQ